ncbi:hypothetical protein C8R45DRAFT_948314 [Mycena sanguinolenta]|nr:hypothetical protein C8R45DRAFT_948314 [Mycena sanguinolenta]
MLCPPLCSEVDLTTLLYLPPSYLRLASNHLRSSGPSDPSGLQLNTDITPQMIRKKRVIPTVGTGGNPPSSYTLPAIYLACSKKWLPPQLVHSGEVPRLGLPVRFHDFAALGIQVRKSPISPPPATTVIASTTLVIHNCRVLISILVQLELRLLRVCLRTQLKGLADRPWIIAVHDMTSGYEVQQKRHSCWIHPRERHEFSFDQFPVEKFIREFAWLLVYNGVGSFGAVVATISSPPQELEIVAELALEDGESQRKISHQLIWWLTATSLFCGINSALHGQRIQQTAYLNRRAHHGKLKLVGVPMKQTQVVTTHGGHVRGHDSGRTQCPPKKAVTGGHAHTRGKGLRVDGVTAWQYPAQLPQLINKYFPLLLDLNIALGIRTWLNAELNLSNLNTVFRFKVQAAFHQLASQSSCVTGSNSGEAEGFGGPFW